MLSLKMRRATEKPGTGLSVFHMLPSVQLCEVGPMVPSSRTGKQSS